MEMRKDRIAMDHADITPSATNPSAQPATKRRPLTVPVEGMTCASCVRRVETGAAKVAGVTKSAVNFATKKLTIETDEGFRPRRSTRPSASSAMKFRRAPWTMRWPMPA